MLNEYVEYAEKEEKHWAESKNIPWFRTFNKFHVIFTLKTIAIYVHNSFTCLFSRHDFEYFGLHKHDLE